MGETIRILIVDDHCLVRRGLRYILKPVEDMEVVGDYATAEEAFQEIKYLQPHVVLLDSEMLRMNGVEAADIVEGNEPDCEYTIISLAKSVYNWIEALETGTVSYLIQDITLDELINAIRKSYEKRCKSFVL